MELIEAGALEMPRFSPLYLMASANAEEGEYARVGSLREG